MLHNRQIANSIFIALCFLLSTPSHSQEPGPNDLPEAAPLGQALTGIREGETGEEDKESLISMDFPEMTEIAIIAEHIARKYNKNILLNPKIKGKIKIIAPEKINKEEAYQIFLSSLDVLGLTTIETGKIIKIMKVRDGIKSNPPVYASPNQIPDSDLLITQVIPLKYIDVKLANSTISRFATSGSIVSLASTNTIIVSDSAKKVARIVQILSLLDVKSQQPQLKLIPIKNRYPKDIKEKIDTILKIAARKGKKGRRQDKHVLFAEEALPAIAIFAPPALIERVESLVRSFDTPIAAGGNNSDIYIRPLEFSDAKKLASTLSTISTANRRKSKLSKQNTSGDLKITADEESNSLIIKGELAAYRAVDHVIRKLDARKSQVLVEADILEINAKNSFSTSSSLLAGYGNENKNSSNIITAWQAGIAAPLVISDSQGGGTQAAESAKIFSDQATVGVISGSGINIDGLGKVNPALLIKFLKTDGDTRVLSSPYILTADHQEASITVGETVFFSSNQTDSFGATQEKVEKENVDLTLVIKTTIAHNGKISLDLNIESNAVTGISSEGLPRLSKRKIKQHISIKDGQTVLIAGLKGFRKSESFRKIPLFGSLPFLGPLFRTQIKSSSMKQLAVFITPRVIHNSADFSKIYKEKLRQSHGFLDMNQDEEVKNFSLPSESTGIEGSDHRKASSKL